MGLTKPLLAEPSSLPPEVGYNYGNIETARTTATAQGLRALSTSLSALYANPANIELGRVYHVGGLLELSPDAQKRTYGVAAVDSVTNSSVGAGLGVNWSQQDPEGVDRDYFDVRLAVAAPVSDRFLIGIGGQYLKLSQSGQGPLGESLASSGLDADPITNEWGVDAGITVTPSDRFTVSAVGTNLNDPGHGFLPTNASLALGVSILPVNLGADLTFDFTTWERTTLRPAVGAEAILADNFPVRLGYRYDEGAGSHALSGGLGYLDQQLALDLALRSTVSGEASTMFVATFTFFLESSGMVASPTEGF